MHSTRKDRERSFVNSPLSPNIVRNLIRWSLKDKFGTNTEKCIAVGTDINTIPGKMRIAVGSDMKTSLTEAVIRDLEVRGYEVDRYGALVTEPTPWPDVAFEVAGKIAAGEYPCFSVGPGRGSALPRTKCAV